MAVLRELQEKYARRESAAVNLAAVYAGLGDKDRAFAWLERDFQARTGLLIFITILPDYDTLRGDPRYTGLLGHGHSVVIWSAELDAASINSGIER